MTQNSNFQIITLSKQLESDWAWISGKQASYADKINKNWFTQSQKKEHLNLVSNKIKKVFCWNRTKHKRKMSNVNGSKPQTIYWFTQGQTKDHLNWIREMQFRDPSIDTAWIK